MDSLNILAFLSVIIISLLTILAWCFKSPDSSNIEVIHDKYILVDSKWDRFNSDQCFYDLHLYGFQAFRRDSDRVRSVIVLESCDTYEINQKLLIQSE